MKRVWLATGAFVAAVLFVMFLVHLMGQPAAAEAPSGATNWQTYVTLLGNVPHWMLEVTIEVITGVAGYAIGRGLVARHDKRHPDEERIRQIAREEIVDYATPPIDPVTRRPR